MLTMAKWLAMTPAERIEESRKQDAVKTARDSWNAQHIEQRESQRAKWNAANFGAN